MTTLPTPAVARHGKGRCEASGCITASVYHGEHLTEPVVRVHSSETDTTMQARISEWRKFVAEVKAGDWDHIDTDYEFAIARHAAASMVFAPDVSLVNADADADADADAGYMIEDPARSMQRFQDLVDLTEHKAR